MKARKRIIPKKPVKPAAKTAAAKKKARAIKPSGKRASSKASDAEFEDPPTAKRAKPRSTDTRSDERAKPGARSRSADAERPKPKKARAARDTTDEDEPKARAPEGEDLEDDDAIEASADGESNDGEDIEDAEEDVDSASEADEAAREVPLMSDISEIRGARVPSEAGDDPQLIEGDVDLDVLDIAADSQPTPTTRSHLKRVVESLIFVADSAVTANQLARLVKAKAAEVKEVVQEIMRDFEGRGIELVEVSGGYQFRSAAASAPFVRDLVAHRPVRLTRAQLETLALIAYRQPITRPEIDDVRGVDSGSAIKVLLDRDLLKILGRKDEAGRPLLYGTAPQFLDFFGMKSLQDLPTLREFTELNEENRELFARKMGEVPEDLSDPSLDPVVVHTFDEDDEDSVRPPPAPGTEPGTDAETHADVDPESESRAEAESAPAEAGEDELESAGEPHDDDAGEAGVSSELQAGPSPDDDESDDDSPDDDESDDEPDDDSSDDDESDDESDDDSPDDDESDDELSADATLEVEDLDGTLEPDESEPDPESSDFVTDASDSDDDDSSRPT